MVGPFRAFAGSTIGARHVQRGQAIEDSSASLESSSLAAVAVADGVSDPRCVHAEVGSRLAVDLALTMLELHWDLIDQPGLFCRRLVDQWLAHTEQHAAEANEAFHPLSYATTLIFAGSHGDRHVIGKVGDGDAFAARGVPARVYQPFPPEHCAGPVTMGHAEAADELSLVTFDDDLELRFILVATDGYAAPFASDEWPEEVTVDLLTLIEHDRINTIPESIDEWIIPAARVGGDDVSLGLIVRDHGVAG